MPFAAPAPLRYNSAMEDPRHDMALTLLAWYREMGVDGVLDGEPTNWLERGGRVPGEALRSKLQGLGSQAHGAAAHPASTAEAGAQPRTQPPADTRTTPLSGARSATQGRQSAPPAPAPTRVFTSKPPDAAETAARASAKAASSMAELAGAIAAFDGCGLKATASKTCVYRGAEQARLMIIGEAPGRDEDLEGKPFVGRAGQLLDRMLAAIGLGEGDVHVTNIVYWRPPGNRTPTPHEAQICRPFLERQVELVRPELVLLLGGPATNHILDVTEGIMRVRGRWKEATIGTHNVRAMPTLHPAYLLRTPAAKRLAWQDLLAIKIALQSP